VGKVKVCIIDNDKSILFLLQLLLKRVDKDADLITFPDGKEAFSFICDHAQNGNILPDVILLDLNMEKMDGWQFLEAYEGLIDKLAHNISIYIHSSSQAESDISRANSNPHVSGYLDKPIEEEIFANVLAKARAQKNA
jgi:CheY-like chemotaxis protein